MSNELIYNTLDILAHSNRIVGRRSRLHVQDPFERKVLFDRAALLNHKAAGPRFGYEPSLLPGVEQLSAKRSTAKSALQIAATPYKGVRARVFSIPLPATFVYFAYRMKRQWGWLA